MLMPDYRVLLGSLVLREKEIIIVKKEIVYDESEKNLIFQIGNFPEIVKMQRHTVTPV